MEHSSRACSRVLALLLPTALLVIGGCAKPTFTVVDKRVCKGVDGAGKPLGETSIFSPEDGRVFIWFRYRNASPGQVIKARFTYADGLGTESTQEVQSELKPGSLTGAAELSGEEGAPLASGKYTVELTNQSDVSYGPPLTFTVQ